MVECSTANQQTSSVDLGCHVSYHPLQALELVQSLAELYALLHVLDSLIQSALCDTQSLRSDTDTATVQSHHSDLEAAVLLAQQTVCRQMNVLKDQLSGLGTTDAHLVLDLADGEARVVLVNDERRNALVALGLVGHSKYNVGICTAAAGDEHLGAVHDVGAVLLLNSHGLLCSGVSTCVRLGQAECTDLGAFLRLDQRTQPLLLLLRGAESVNRPSTQGAVSGHNAAGGTAYAAHFLDCDRVANIVTAGTADFLRELNAHQSVLHQLLNGFLRIALFRVDLSCDRLYFVQSELAAHLLEQCFFFCKPKIHAINLPNK